ncbi:MAG: DUF664 domain-containing protein [Bacteroidia bacterium]|nr:DUF664 domain-containing protein [Bacteroidia bacterium]
MTTQYLLQLFQRDLSRLKDEINAFQDESNLWKTSGTISNSTGNLALHVTGNLSHFVGAVLGQTGYIRHRESEFTSKGVPRADLLRGLDGVIDMLGRVIPRLEAANLDENYPLDLSAWFKPNMETGYFLIHLYGHLNYHLGQINYLRRVLEGN